MNTRQSKCTLYVIGYAGIGKTFLINSLLDFNLNKLTTHEIFNAADWLITTDNFRINVEIKESRMLDKNTIARIKKNRDHNSYILFVVNFDDKKKAIEIDPALLRTLKELSTHATILVAQTFSESNPISISGLRRAFPFVEFFFKISGLVREYKSLYTFIYTLKQIIINNNSDELDYAKKLISENKSTKDKILDLGNCNLTSLSDVKELFNNIHLETLILSNEWGSYNGDELIREVSQNKRSANVLFALPAEISKLKKLRVLICGGNWQGKRKRDSRVTNWHINDISNLSLLPDLSILNLSNNEIEIVACINKLKNLTQLYLNNNNIEKIPSITNLKLLREIYLSNNRLLKVDFLAKQLSLTTIDLHSNRIKDLSPITNLISKLNVKDSKWENNTISISKKPLITPPIEVAMKGKKSILAYFRRLDAEKRIQMNSFKNNDVKLIMVGNSNAGKTTLVHWLKTGLVNKKIATTHWLKFDRWIAKKDNSTYNIRIFDFGGQEYYHDTHHLFFTNRTAYVILWDASSNSFDEIDVNQQQGNGKIEKVKVETFPIDYWLDSVRYHTQKKKKSQTENSIEKLLDERDFAIAESLKTGDSWTKAIVESTDKIERVFVDEENVLICQNKVDTKRAKKFIDEESYKKKHPFIFDFTSISLYNKNGLELFTDLLFDIFNNMEIVNQEYLGTWGEIKQKIENTEFKNHLTLSEFKDYCNNIIAEMPALARKNKNQIRKVLFNDQDAEIFASFLSDIGICLYYPENSSLKNKVFLNQMQVLANIHEVLLGLKLSNGECTESMIVAALEKTNAVKELANTVQLMLHFKILFKHPNSSKGTFIAPLYLPKEPPQSIKLFNSLFHKPTYRYQYNTFIQKNIILDFFHIYGSKALKETNNESLYYYWRDGIIIKDDASSEIVMVKFISGNQTKQYAYIDIYVIQESENEKFLNKIVDDLEKINQGLLVAKLVSADGENYIPVETILQNEKKGNWIFHYGDKYHKLTDFKKHLTLKIKMKKIFISYSKLDHRLVAKFIEHLSALQRDGKVAHWYCSELEPGSAWNKKIQDQLDEADIICFMVSPNFMKTDYIHEHEIIRAFEKKAKDASFRIVPIILDFCRWSTSENDLSQYTALPYTAKPVADFNNQNMAWYIIEECIRLMINNDLDPVGEDFYTKQKLPSDLVKIYSRIAEGKVDKNTE